MRKKYADCRRADGDCTICPLVNYGRDCHNRPITKLEWSRRMAGMRRPVLTSARSSGWSWARRRPETSPPET